MKITAVTTAVVQANFDYTYVRVHTDEGVHGTGECFPAPGLSRMLAEFGDLLIGRDPRAITPLWKLLMAAISGSGSSSASGIAYNAISGIEAALWDLNGKLLGVPVVRLLGGAFRDSVDVYADLHAGGELASLTPTMRYRRPFWLTESGQTEFGALYWEAAEEEAATSDGMIARAREAVAAGYRYLKFDLDVFTGEREAAHRGVTREDLRRLADQALALRRAVGDDVGIAFDCHWRFDVPSALAVAQAVAPAVPMWLEDPVPPEPVAHADVARNSPVPIATGENTYLVEGFAALMTHRAAHILTPDVQKTGGIGETLRIGELAARSFFPIAPHCIASPLGLLGAVHVCAALSNVLCLEFHGTDVPFWNALVGFDTSLVAGGKVRVPEAPGIGVELDLDVVRRYAAPGEAIFGDPPAR
jgi:L-alanine-DL-glutamate epimerase-like enolase superfamily enzyme